MCLYVMWTLCGQCSAVCAQQFAPEQQGLSIVTAAGDHITLQDYDASGALFTHRSTRVPTFACTLSAPAVCNAPCCAHQVTVPWSQLDPSCWCLAANPANHIAFSAPTICTAGQLATLEQYGLVPGGTQSHTVYLRGAGKRALIQ